MDREIVIQQKTETPDSEGSVSPVWTTFASVWADVRFLRANERFVAATHQSIKVANFRIWFLPGLSPTMRISYDSLYWNITGIAELGLHEGHDLTAEAIYGGG